MLVLFMKNLTLKALIQNFGFSVCRSEEELPPIDYVYPSYTADGLTESFRFCAELRYDLSKRESVVQDTLKGKEIILTRDQALLLEVDEIAPRLRLKEQLSDRCNSVYNYYPILFVGGSDDSNLTIFLVKPTVVRTMAWFEFTEDETSKICRILTGKANKKPYRSLWQKLIGCISRNETKGVRRHEPVANNP